jgi:hypothetical protein
MLQNRLVARLVFAASAIPGLHRFSGRQAARLAETFGESVPPILHVGAGRLLQLQPSAGSPGIEAQGVTMAQTIQTSPRISGFKLRGAATLW